MRKMATIRKIDAIVPIPEADNIETAIIGGWKVVVKNSGVRKGNEEKAPKRWRFIEIDDPEAHISGKKPQQRHVTPKPVVKPEPCDFGDLEEDDLPF